MTRLKKQRVLLMCVLAGMAAGCCRDDAQLVCGSFEECQSEVGLPNRIGVWGGDKTEVVGTKNGVSPHDGVRMLEFRRGFFDTESGNWSDVCQLVAVPPDVIEELQLGATYQANASAWFAFSSTARESCQVSIVALDRLPPGGMDQSVYLPPLAASETTNESVVKKQELGRWSKASATLILPKETQYLGVYVAGANAAGLDEQYADCVELCLKRISR